MKRNREIAKLISLSLLIRQLSTVKLHANSCTKFEHHLEHSNIKIRTWKLEHIETAESHDVLLGPAGLFSFAIKSLFDALKRVHRKFVVRCRAAQFGSEQLIDLFAKHSKCFSKNFWTSKSRFTSVKVHWRGPCNRDFRGFLDDFEWWFQMIRSNRKNSKEFGLKNFSLRTSVTSCNQTPLSLNC